VDIDARQIGKSYAPTHAIVASAAELLGGLAERLDRCLDRCRPCQRPVAGGIVRQALPASRHPMRIAPQDALRELQALLPDDTIFTIDSGEHFAFAVQYLESVRPDAFVAMTGLGSMGQSIGAAIGAQLAHPGRSVAAICGDGCFAMNAFEIATAVAERLPIRVFVFNDERLGMVENGHTNVYGRTPSFKTGPLDVCSIARGLGALTMRIDAPGQLQAMGSIVRSVAGPMVIDVRIDATIVLPKRDRVNQMVKPLWHVVPRPTAPTRVPYLRVVH
jgi:acetolactate synthase-1/2/3 large subunit